MRVLVTGIAGFIGSHIAERLLEQGNEVWGVDNLRGGFMENVPKQIIEKGRFVEADIYRDSFIVRRFIDTIKPEVIHHLACYPYEGLSQFCPTAVSESVYMVSLEIFKAAVNSNVKRVVYYSSMARYGEQDAPFDEEINSRNPCDVYGAAKVAAEVALEAISKASGLEYTILVPHNISGPRMRLEDPFRGVLGIWVNCLMWGRPFYIYGIGDAVRAFSHIDDVVEPCIRAGYYDNVVGQVINIGSNQPMTLDDVADIVIEEFRRIMVKEAQPPLYVDSRPCEVKVAFCTVEKSQRLLGFEDKKTINDLCKDLILYAKEKGPKEFNYDEFQFEITKGLPEVWGRRLI